MAQDYYFDLSRALRLGQVMEAELVLDIICRDSLSRAESVAKGRAAAKAYEDRLSGAAGLPEIEPLPLPMPGFAIGSTLHDVENRQRRQKVASR